MPFALILVCDRFSLDPQEPWPIVPVLGDLARAVGCVVWPVLTRRPSCQSVVCCLGGYYDYSLPPGGCICRLLLSWQELPWFDLTHCVMVCSVQHSPNLRGCYTNLPPLCFYQHCFGYSVTRLGLLDRLTVGVVGVAQPPTSNSVALPLVVKVMVTHVGLLPS